MIEVAYNGDFAKLLEINSDDHYHVSYDAEKIKQIINDYATVNAKDKFGKYFIHYAAQFGMNDIVSFLIEKEANLNVELKRTKMTPLFLALVNGHYETAQLLLSNGATLLSKGESIDEILKDDDIENYTSVRIDQQKKKEFITFLLEESDFLTKEEKTILRNYRLKLLFKKTP